MALSELTKTNLEIKKNLKASIEQEVKAGAHSAALADLLKEHQKAVSDLSKDRSSLREAVKNLQGECQELRVKHRAQSQNEQMQIKRLQEAIAQKASELEAIRAEQEQRRSSDARAQSKSEQQLEASASRIQHLESELAKKAGEIEEAKETLRIKDKIVEDKDKTIQKLKSEISAPNPLVVELQTEVAVLKNEIKQV